MPILATIFLLLTSLAQPSAEVSNQITLMRDVAYTTPSLNSFHKPLTMDVAFPNSGDEPLPVIIYLHGGGWDGGSKNEGERFLSLMAHGGYFATSIEFRGTKEGGFKNTLSDIYSAINFIVKYKSELNIDPDLIGIVGYSSGGHLAVLSACSQNNQKMKSLLDEQSLASSLKCAASINGAVVPKYLPSQHKSAFFKWSGAEKEREMDFAYPSTYIDKNDAPIYLLSGKEDKVVPNRLARQFSNELKRKNVDHEFVTIQKTGHVITEPSHYLGMLSFIDSHLKGNAHATLLKVIQEDTGSME